MGSDADRASMMAAAAGGGRAEGGGATVGTEAASATDCVLVRRWEGAWMCLANYWPSEGGAQWLHELCNGQASYASDIRSRGDGNVGARAAGEWMFGVGCGAWVDGYTHVREHSAAVDGACERRVREWC